MLSETRRHRSAIPIINLIQHVRHAKPGDPRYPFLKHKAVRICVSQETRDAVAASHQVNGPLYAVPNGIDRKLLPTPANNADRPIDLLIAAYKQPQLGRQLASGFQRPGLRVALMTGQIARSEFLQRLNQAKVTVFLPLAEEGFYLPALEGMGARTLVVCPDCVGNRSFCINEQNCFAPSYASENIINAVESALRLSPDMTQVILKDADDTFAAHDLLIERRAFLSLLDNIDQLW